ncbi:substrate-binding domain-containing protein [Streptomyces sp. BH-SS-21]|uniref:Substrate-binding domain-containing protein n=1 Tax=Streptomyces liliiviolaceus TaxID=2823109 RepID=A0A941BJ21_9ACTN|nr:substrate-binding domain-containing protein [Streptomyces liliiviolaceus]MBQ0855524.1 substrate-binding domain-containing protein [Streptomyces liliiviolaceus]
MRKMAYRSLMGAYVAMVTSVATGCGTTPSDSSASAGSENASEKLSITAVYGLSSDPFWTTLGCGAKNEAARLGVAYKEYTSANSEASSYAQKFSLARQSKPDGMIVNPSDPNQFTNQYETLMSDGVPVVTINSAAPATQYKVVGTDTEDLDFLSDLAELVPSGSGSMAIVNGVAGLEPVDSRLDPVVSAIKEANPNLRTLAPKYTGYDVAKATSAVSSLLADHTDLKVIVAADGPDGTATAAAVQQAGKSGRVTVIALDATPTEVLALNAGTITALVAQSPVQIGEQQVKAVVNYLRKGRGGAVPASSDKIGVTQKVLTADNIDESADWVYKSGC